MGRLRAVQGRLAHAPSHFCEHGHIFSALRGRLSQNLTQGVDP